MNAQSINVNQADICDELVAPSAAIPVSLLPGFIHHFQDGRRNQHEAQRLYAMSDADLDGSGISREGIPARLSAMHAR